MAIKFSCPACGKQHTVPEERAGATGKCSCGQAIKVPAAVASVAAPAPPPKPKATEPAAPAMDLLPVGADPNDPSTWQATPEARAETPLPGTLYHERDRSWMRDFVPRPAEVTVLCVLGWLGTALMVVAGVALVFVGPAAAAAARHARGLPAGATGAAVGVMAVAGATVVVVAILVGLLYGQLWKGRNWARIVLIVCQVLNLAGGMFAAMQGENVARAVGRIGFGLIFLGLLNTPRTKEYCQQ